MKIKDLAALVLEFVEASAPTVECVTNYDDMPPEPVYLDVKDTLAMWMQLPDSAYSAMFVGWCIAKGHSIREFSPSDLEKAVCTALTGSEKNVLTGWEGYLDGTKKFS